MTFKRFQFLKDENKYSDLIEDDLSVKIGKSYERPKLYPYQQEILNQFSPGGEDQAKNRFHRPPPRNKVRFSYESIEIRTAMFTTEELREMMGFNERFVKESFNQTINPANEIKKDFWSSKTDFIDVKNLNNQQKKENKNEKDATATVLPSLPVGVYQHWSGRTRDSILLREDVKRSGTTRPETLDSIPSRDDFNERANSEVRSGNFCGK